MRKVCEDTNKYPRGQFKNQQKVGGHFVGKPSDPNQTRNQNLEGKGVKSSGSDQLNFRTCFRCGEKGHISTQCGKNREVGPQKGNSPRPKAVYCVQQEQVNTQREELGTMATQAELPTQVENREPDFPLAEINIVI